jgi:hypothetical protein
MDENIKAAFNAMTQSQLTKREQFAAMAMQSIISSRNGFMVDCGTDNFAVWAVQCADNLIAELAKEIEQDDPN